MTWRDIWYLFNKASFKYDWTRDYVLFLIILKKIVDLFVTKKLLTSGSFFSEEFPLNKISIFFVLDIVNE